MVKAKKAAPIKAKVTSTKTKRLKGVTSTPLSKAKLSLTIAPDSDAGVTIRKGDKSVLKEETIVETPKRISPAKGAKRSGISVNSILSDGSIKKAKKKAVKSTKKLENNTSEAPAKRTTRLKKSPASAQLLNSPAAAPKKAASKTGKKVAASANNNLNNSKSNDTPKKGKALPKKTKSVKKVPLKSKAVVAGKAKRLSAIKSVLTPKKGRKAK